MKSANFCREALEAWKKVSDEAQVRAWHQKFTPQICYNDEVLDNIVLKYKERMGKIIALKLLFMKELGVKETKAWKILKTLKSKLLALDHTIDLKQNYKEMIQPDLDDGIFENLWIKLCSDRDAYLKETQRQTLKKRIDWEEFITTKYDFIKPKYLEEILLTILY